MVIMAAGASSEPYKYNGGERGLSPSVGGRCRVLQWVLGPGLSVAGCWLTRSGAGRCPASCKAGGQLAQIYLAQIDCPAASSSIAL
jgi:hypothetical protein